VYIPSYNGVVCLAIGCRIKAEPLELYRYNASGIEKDKEGANNPKGIVYSSSKLQVRL